MLRKPALSECNSASSQLNFSLMYDLIGDIHGYADELVRLLETLGYQEVQGVFRHPERQVIFCGDFIDRGPQIRDVLRICRSMCENGSAEAVMGNHEFNALAYATPDPSRPGKHLRTHTEGTRRQHQATLDQLSEQELESALDWFRGLPMWLDKQQLRVVHACWDQRDMLVIREALPAGNPVDTDFLIRATRISDPLYRSVERTLKGPEMRLPGGLSVTDREGNVRRQVRTRWFERPEGRSCAEYMMPRVNLQYLQTTMVTDSDRPAPYAADEPPLFFGHYWLYDSTPAPLRPNIACLDYSVARNGMLTAYRYHGENRLSAASFVSVRRPPQTPDCDPESTPQDS